jgi:hypothetical protein
MNILIKYGSILAAGVITWLLIVHSILHLDGDPRVLSLTSFYFNILPVVCLTLGIRERRSRNNGELAFGEGVVTGAGIMAFYLAVTSLVVAIIGPSLFAALSPAGQGISLGQFLPRLIVSGMLGGLFLSAIITFLLRRLGSLKAIEPPESRK